MSDINEQDQFQTTKYSLSKNESKLFSVIVKYGPQTKKELIFSSAIAADKFDETIELLQVKGLIQLEGEVLLPTLPVNNVLSLLESSLNEIESNKENQQELSKQHFKNIQENLKEFNVSLEGQLNELKTSNTLLQANFKDDLETLEQQRSKKTKELADELTDSFTTKASELSAELKSSFTAKESSFDKVWTKFLDEFQVIPESGTHSLRESVSKYEKELSSIITSTIAKIKSTESRFSDILTTIESESLSQIQNFFSSVETASGELKTNIDTELHESWKHERDFVNEVRKHVQVTLEEEITKALKNVVDSLAKEIDSGINEALNNVKIQTDNVVNESTSQFKTEFNEFAEAASEMILAQKSSLDVLNTELTELSSEKKLTSQKELLLKKLHSQLSAELNSLEGNYRRLQKKVNEIMENIRQSAKNRLIQQSSEFEKLITTFNEANEKAIGRKDLDVIHLQQISQSVSQFLINLLVSIPGNTNAYKLSLKDNFDTIKSELQKSLSESTDVPIKDINTNLTTSQKKVDNLFRETAEETKKEIENVNNSSEQLINTVSSLQQTYSEKIENRFEQRSKVMNTELEAVSRNFQQVLNGIQSGFGTINERISSNNVARITDIETSIQNTVSSLENDLEAIFTRNQTQNKEFSKQLQKNFDSHLNRTLEVIKEGFSQIQSEFKLELENQLKDIDKKNEKQQNDLISVIASFSDHTSNKLNEFKNNITKSLEENEKTIEEFISENQRTTNEVINLHKANIAKYQERGPTDILNFIKQIEIEVSTQNKNLKESMEELTSYYAGFSDSTLNEVSNLIRQVQETGDKLNTIANDALQSITSSLSRTSENIDLYFANSLSDLENQIGVVSGFITSEIDSATEIVKEEAENLKSEMSQTVESLNNEVKDLVVRQDQEFQVKIPELSKEFESIFDDLIKERSQSNQELEEFTQKNLEKLIENWDKEIQKVTTALQDILKALSTNIESSLENFETIVNKNVEDTIKRINSIFSLDSSKEDIFGLREIQSKVNQANKRLKSAINDSLQSHIERFDEKLPEIVNSFEAIHNQTEEDLTTYIGELRDVILSSQTSLSTQIHEYMKDERDNLNFNEINDELKEIMKNFSQSTAQEIEIFSTNLADTIKKSIDKTNNSREEFLKLLTGIPHSISEQQNNVLSELIRFKEKTVEFTDDVYKDSRKEIVNSLQTYNNDLDKGTLEIAGKSTKLIQSLSEAIEKQIAEMQGNSHKLLDKLKTVNTLHKESLEELAKELASTKPDRPIRLLNLATNEARVDYIKGIINQASKQVTIFASNPTFLSPEDLRSIPSEKRIWIYSNYDFTKKGKKWLSEIGEQVNINIRTAKAKKISGVIVVQDNESALVLPDTLGYITTDPRFISHLTELLSLLKGVSLRKKSST